MFWAKLANASSPRAGPFEQASPQHPQAQQQRQRQQHFFWKKWPGAKLADDAAPRRYFEQGMHKTSKPNNNDNDNNNSFGKMAFGQSLPMPARRGQALSSKLRPNTPKPNNNHNDNNNSFGKNGFGKACQCQLTAGRPFRVSFTPTPKPNNNDNDNINVCPFWFFCQCKCLPLCFVVNVNVCPLVLLSMSLFAVIMMPYILA